MNGVDVLGRLATMALHHGSEWEQIHDAVAALIAERDRLANIVASHEKQIARMTGERAALVEALRIAQDALLAYDGHVSNPMHAEGWTDQEGYKAYARAAAALARVQGGAA